MVEADPVPTADAEQDAIFLAIVQGRQQPDPSLVRAGRDDHAAGKHFHEGPRPFHTVEALCWRIGWNERALEQRE